MNNALNNETTTNIDDHMNVIRNLVIGIMERDVTIDVAIERAVKYHVAMVRGEKI